MGDRRDERALEAEREKWRAKQRKAKAGMVRANRLYDLHHADYREAQAALLRLGPPDDTST